MFLRPSAGHQPERRGLVWVTRQLAPRRSRRAGRTNAATGDGAGALGRRPDSVPPHGVQDHAGATSEPHADPGASSTPLHPADTRQYERTVARSMVVESGNHT